ncbi:MAG: glycosyltransferase, partial [Clostridiales bacterium]|nr:glycosyltransferase [Clostridiales bacterium]
MLLSIGMIVKNEEKTLRACLEGIKPILERVESELIIADTGSTDGTMAIAREFTRNVYPIEWRGDFAWARNTTLDKSSGEWYMFLDADEVFQDVSDIIRFFNSGEYRRYRSASHLMTMQGDEARNTYTRLYKKERDTRFQGRIHEQIPLQPPVKGLNSLSLHTGYVFEGEEGAAKKAAKHRRNMAPLLEMYRENPHDRRVVALIVNELMSADELGEARRFLDIGLNLGGDRDADVFYHFLQYADLVWSVKSEAFERAADAADNYFKTSPKLFVAAVSMRIAQALALEKLKRRGEAAEAYKEALNLLKAHRAGKLDDEDVRMNVTKSPAKNMEKTAAAGVAGNYAALGDFNGAYEWIKKYGLDTAEMLACVRDGERAGELEGFVRACYKYLPKKGLEALSKRDRFIYYANNAYDYKAQGDALKFVSGIRAALKEDPSMGAAVQKTIEGLTNAPKDDVTLPPAVQLAQETEALKNAVMGLITKGRLGAAGQILEKYAQVNPKDPDIRVMLSIISRALANPSLPSEMELMQKVETVFILSNMIVGGSGVINSVLRKAQLMEETWGARPLILTCSHNIELRRVTKALRAADGKKTGLGRHTKVINAYEYFQHSYAPGLENKAVYPDLSSDDYRRTEDKAVYEVLRDGVPVRREFFTG